ncbi:MAG: hypothetical protein JXJ18_05515 [Rhodobacteraceae bacterium]|nr:hypothetical protein [Paracoccaceae bacterium]
MRPVLHGDAVAAARALCLMPEAARPTAMARMLIRTEAADAYRKRFGRAHPRWGNGSLMSLVQRDPLPPEPALDVPGYCRCLALVFAALADWRAQKAALSGRR